MDRCPSFDYQEGWDARRANLPFDPSWGEAKRNGWNDAQRDDHDEAEFFAAGDHD